MRRPPLSVAYISTASGLSDLGDSLLYVILPSYYPYLGLVPLQVGIILSVHRWTRLATNHIVEYCYRHYPNVPWLIFAFLMASVVPAIYGIAQTFIIFLGARIFWGISYSFIRQAGVMTVIEAGPQLHLTERMGYYRGITAICVAFGVISGGLSHDVFGFTSTFIAVGILSLPAVPLGILSQRGPKQLEKSPTKDAVAKLDFRLILCGFAIGTVGAGMVISTLALIFKEQIGGSLEICSYSISVVTLTGIILGIRWFVRGIASPIFGSIADKIGRERLIPFLFLFGTTTLIINRSYLNPIPLLVFVIIFFICDNALDTLLLAQAAQSGARSVASFVTAIDLGMSVGPLIGWCIPHFGFPINYILMSGGIIYMIGAIIALKRFGILRTY